MQLYPMMRIKKKKLERNFGGDSKSIIFVLLFLVSACIGPALLLMVHDREFQ